MFIYRHRPHRTRPIRVEDQHERGTPIARFNAALAVTITRAVGTMWCAYLFTAFDLLSLPTAIRGGIQPIVSWVAQTLLQLVLLSIIMVGQNVQAEASNVRDEQTNLNTGIIIDELRQMQDHLKTLEARLNAPAD